MSINYGAGITADSRGMITIMASPLSIYIFDGTKLNHYFVSVLLQVLLATAKTDIIGNDK